MYLAGLRVPDEDVRELAKLVDEPTRSFLEKSLALEAEAVCCSRSTNGASAKARLTPRSV
jgi:hypothetical protein